MCLIGRHLQSPTKPVWWIGVNDTTCQNTPSVVRTLVRLLTVTDIKKTVCWWIWRLVRSVLQARGLESSRTDSAIYSSPACFALLSRCFLVQRFPPSYEDIEPIPGCLKSNWVETSSLFWFKLNCYCCGYWGVMSPSSGLYGHYKYVRKDEFTKLCVGFYFIILIKRTLGNYLIN